MLSLLLVEDDIDLAQTLIQYLELEQIQCDHASNGVSGLNLIQQNYYDLILLDLNLLKLDGISVCQKARSAGIDTPVLMLTARDQLDQKLEGFEAGTDDYLVKPFDLEELKARILALSKRRSGQAKQLSAGPIKLDLDQKQAFRGGQPLQLSPIGWTLLEALVRAAPAVVSRQQLEHKVWGEDPPDSNSLKVHIHNLRKVVDTPFTHPIIKTVPGQGLCLSEQP